MAADESSVKVALRIRPQISRELIEGSKTCTRVADGVPQVWIGNDHAYTYDYVFDTDSSQESVFEIVNDLVDGCLDGYNATILAYGQTGSGKTFTMGTGFDVASRHSNKISSTQGIIPRAVHRIFENIQSRRETAQANGEAVPEFKVSAQFVELYNEEVFDLTDSEGGISKPVQTLNPIASSAVTPQSSSHNLNIPDTPPNSADLGPDTPSVKGKSTNYSTSFLSVPSPGARARFGFRSFPTPNPIPAPNTEVKTAFNSPALPVVGRKGATGGGVQIREDANGGIYLVGVGSKPVLSAKEAMDCLYNGALSRTTASTNMNNESSRSHAIFTLHVKQQRMVPMKEEQMDTGAITDCETLTAKFHFVDLAGSERLKRTGAVGDRAKESISINGGLLALGNVISALGDKSKKASHVPYRDSKLTRLLQDSLGGNSRTMMIACVSPSERDFLETLNTLKYANRAKNIRNKVTINQDKNSTIISHLRTQIQQLEVELLEYKQGKRIFTSSGEETESDMYRENVLLQTEITNLTGRIKALQGTIDCLTVKNSQLLTEKATGTWILSDNTNCDLTSMVQKYIQEIEELGAKLVESENTCGQLRKKIESRLSGGPNLNNSLSPRHPVVPMSTGSVFPEAEIVEPNLATVIEDAKKEIKKEKFQIRRLQSKENSRRRARNPADDLMEEDFPSSSEEGDENENETSDLETDDGGDSNVNAELAQLTTEIGTKQRLIDQLELSQKRILGMKEHYEEKLACLANKIKITQEERDTILSNLNSQVTPQGKLKQTKEDYEKKLIGMQTELKKWQSAHKEHQKKLRNQAQHERQIQVLRAEVENMKRIKVKLMNQVKEENVRRRELEFQRNKEIAQLRKADRQKDNFIRSLETENKKKEIVLKRKHEEVNALKKINRNVMSKKAAGHLLSKTGKKFSPIKAKRKWTALREGLIKSSSNKETIENLEKEMLADISSRTALSNDIQDLIRERNDTLFKPTPDRITYINDQIDTLTVNIKFLDEKIADNQRNMLELTSANDDETVSPGMSTVIAELNKDECGYLLEKMYQQSLDVLINSGHQSKLIGVLQQDSIRMHRDLEIAKELVFHLYSKVNDLEPERIVQLESLKSEYKLNENGFGVEDGLGALLNERVLNQTFVTGPKRNAYFDVMRPIHNYEQQKVTPGTRKARRLTATPNELLGDSSKQNNYDQALANFPEESENVFVNPNDIPLLGSLNRVRSSARLQRRDTYTIPESTPSIPVDIKAENNETQQPNIDIQRNFSINRRTFSKASNNSATTNNVANNNGQASSQSQTTLTTTYGAAPNDYKMMNDTFLGSPNNTPPGSPVSSRKAQSQQRDENVFQRLTSSTTSTGDLLSSNGVIRAVRDKSGGLQKGVFSQTHVASGHSKAVLSLCATDDTLYTGSKDGTLKIWDLNTGVELRTLSVQKVGVNCVRFDPFIRCVFSVSSYFIKAWDTRMNNSICMTTFLSSGTTTSGALPLDPNSHVNHLPPGECNILDIATTTFSGLYSTCGERVRIWDLRVSRSIGFLGGKHQSQIMCMATDKFGDGRELMCTGSKDHYIKVYDFEAIEPSRTISVLPKATLEPPHYDGIEALALSDSTLFSGSRDTCIKKWDLTKQEPLVQSVNNSHSGWITGLTYAPGNDEQLISTSRDGVMKLWSVETCAQLGSAKINKNGVNCVGRNASHIFTGYSEGNVGFWRVSKSNQGDLSPVNVKSEVFTADELDQL